MSRRSRIDWDAQPLGQLPDMQLARRLGVSHQAVWIQRTRRRIPVFVRGTAIDWDAQPLGQMPDGALAAQLGCSFTAVYNARLRRKIPCMKIRPVPKKALLTRDRLELLHLRYGLSGAAIGKLLEVDASEVGRALLRFGIGRTLLEACRSPRARQLNREAQLRRRSAEARMHALRKLVEEEAAE